MPDLLHYQVNKTQWTLHSLFSFQTDHFDLIILYYTSIMLALDLNNYFILTILIISLKVYDEITQSRNKLSNVVIFESWKNIETIGRSQTICSYRMSEIRVHLEMSDIAPYCLSVNFAMIVRSTRKRS